MEGKRKLIEMNLSWEILKLCSQYQVTSNTIIDEIKQRVVDDIHNTLLEKGLGIEHLKTVSDGRLAQLELELKGKPIPPAEGRAVEPEKRKAQGSTKSKDFKPKAKEQTQKLGQERKPLAELLRKECVQYGLIDTKRAEYLIRQLPGKEPKAAEQEVVVELRNTLYEQVRQFIRTHKGGPWGSPTDQDEIRLDITNTPSVRSLLSLMLHLVKEQREWLEANKKGVRGKAFGQNISLKP
jgi:hypothetical protein